MLGTAIVWNYISTNPVEGARLPENARQEKKFYTPEQARTILAAADEPFKTLLWVAGETGLRGGELCGLRVPDLDLDQQAIFVRQSAWRGKLQSPKTANAERRVPISKVLAAHLREYLKTWKENPDQILFPSQAGTPQDNNNVNRFQLNPLVDKLKLPRLGLHAFRHLSASMMDKLNVPLKTRTARLGHSDPLLTLRVYTHEISNDERQIADELGSQLFPVCAQVQGQAVAV